MLRIRKDDVVMVVSGKDKGKTGKVMRVFPQDCRALVENINLVKKAKRRTQQDQKGGIVDIEASIHHSNLMVLHKQNNKATRVSVDVLKDGSKTRKAKLSGVAI